MANVSTTRGWWNAAVRAVIEPVASQLAGVTPHVMRRAGMTHWFPRFDQNLIQNWGGWTSLKQMLDTYRGVLNSLEDIDLDGLDRFDDEWEFVISEVEPSEVAETDIISEPDAQDKVIDMHTWRKRGQHSG